ncbi:MAG: peptide deformylase [Pseudomonadota bacterium]|nr:MAG: peptide deformylase [Pseudomonadota bacterium]
MAKLEILHYPDERLRIKARSVEQVDDGIRQLISDMFETMYEAPGIGLAATQVDRHQRIIVIDVSENKSKPLALINPEIIASDGAQELEEGCLSVPGVYEPVTRAGHIKLRTLDQEGNSVEMEAEGLLAVCIQHEMDHLEGKLFVDYLSGLKRQRIRKKLEKQQRRVAL